MGTLSGSPCQSTDGSRASAETFRRIACDCGLLAVSGAGGSQLNIGRRSHQIPPAIRRALFLRDRGCRFPGCTNTRFLHGHHLRHWLHRGETSLGTLSRRQPAGFAGGAPSRGGLGTR